MRNLYRLIKGALHVNGLGKNASLTLCQMEEG